MPVSIVQRILGILFILTIVAALVMPQFSLFVPPSDPVSPKEEICAWRAAREFAYDTAVDRFFIRNHTTRVSPYGPLTYSIYPVTYFSLPWPKATVRCIPDRHGRLVPYEGWTAAP